MKNQFDQYNRPIPQDLILLVLIVDSEEQAKKILDLDWYCFEGNKTNHIFVSQSKLEEILGGLTDAEIGPDDLNCKYNLVKINDVIKRQNEKDGFYWA
jgi:hypothetical protein